MKTFILIYAVIALISFVVFEIELEMITDDDEFPEEDFLYTSHSGNVMCAIWMASIWPIAWLLIVGYCITEIIKKNA